MGRGAGNPVKDNVNPVEERRRGAVGTYNAPRSLTTKVQAHGDWEAGRVGPKCASIELGS